MKRKSQKETITSRKDESFFSASSKNKNSWSKTTTTTPSPSPDSIYYSAQSNFENVKTYDLSKRIPRMLKLKQSFIEEMKHEAELYWQDDYNYHEYPFKIEKITSTLKITMFIKDGHFIIRIDGKDEKNNTISLDIKINAKNDQSKSISFANKNLTGVINNEEVIKFIFIALYGLTLISPTKITRGTQNVIRHVKQCIKTDECISSNTNNIIKYAFTSVRSIIK